MAGADTGVVLRRLIEVDFVNKLPPNHNVSVHCKSKNDDLGIHVLGPHQGYGFQFHDSLLGNTLFFSGVTTDFGHGVYNIYTHRRDADRCTKCLWEITQVGVYGFRKDSGSPDIYFRWA
ncbi:hypothetical protein SAY87_006674 [Trapa incisa]|uniref:S-protein homolog n=1 Tax=Trapa incisa TaxID=236973 RepID=A0AAN7K1E0_9MYRT|nr:hypothetical protein SAY87_006674 [Trapa incisa]